MVLNLFALNFVVFIHCKAFLDMPKEVKAEQAKKFLFESRYYPECHLGFHLYCTLRASVLFTSFNLEFSACWATNDERLFEDDEDMRYDGKISFANYRTNKPFNIQIN